MNCPEIHELWELCRDGAASAAQRQAFDAHLRSCPGCTQRWQQESQWLTTLAAPDPDLAAPGADDAFATAVLAQWQPAPANSHWRWQPWFGAVLAAAAAVAVLVTWFAPDTTPSFQPPPPGALSLLARELDQNYAQPPVRAYREVRQTTTLLRERLQNLRNPIELPILDPARYLAPESDNPPADPPNTGRLPLSQPAYQA